MKHIVIETVDRQVLHLSTQSGSNTLAMWPTSSDEALVALDNVSRRIDDLARRLNVLGHFGDDPDRPTAA